MYYQPELDKWFNRVAKENGGQQAKDLWRTFQKAVDLDKFEKDEVILTRRMDIWLEQKVLHAQALEDGPLTPEQVEELRETETDSSEWSIWQNEVRLIPASGNKMLIDWS